MNSQVKDVCIEALRRVYNLQRELMQKEVIGEIIAKGSGLDKAIRGDWESEEAVINFLKKQRLPAMIISEEHGQFSLSKKPAYLVVLDGIDGSSGLAANPKARCGTIISVADNLNPKYDDFIFSGVTEFSQERIAYVSKGDKVRLIEQPGKLEKTAIVDKIFPKPLCKETKIHIDDKQFYPDYKEGITISMDKITKLMRNVFSNKLNGKFELSGMASTSSMFIDLVLGKVDAVCGVIVKGVFEPPAGYLLSKTIGGEVYGFSNDKWEKIDNKKWQEYGKPISPVLFAASPELANELISILKSS
ncbi:hypothetical protein J4225_02265 [Candidatus Pacearchaeota archaeon]|nr:hypothetical protein [Candidatus Pacearchaeota archaeon]